MEIVYYPDPVLQKRAGPVDLAWPELRDFVGRMLETMKEAHGVGLAAPQVGESLRLFVASDTAEPEDALVCINPELRAFGPSVSMEEGCLSLPGLNAPISRPEKVELSWTDLEGERRTAEFDDLMARILQHEFDHLEGTLFFERMTPADRVRIKDDLESFEAQYRVS